MRRALVVAALAAVPLVGGCVTVDNTSSPETSAAGTTAGAATATTAAAPTESTATSAAPPPTTTATQAPGTPNCPAGQLSAQVTGSEGAAGSVYHTLSFTNTGSQACVLSGFPGVSYVTGASGEQVGAAAERSGSAKGPVTLAPGGSTTAQVQAVQVANYPEADCDPTPVNGLRVYPPNDRGALFVALPGTGCAKDGVKQLSVTAVG